MYTYTLLLPCNIKLACIQRFTYLELRQVLDHLADQGNQVILGDRRNLRVLDLRLDPVVND